MDLVSITRTLEATLHPDNATRTQAEAALEQFELTQGYQGCLLQIVTKTDIARHLRQAAAVRLKNIIHKWWSVREGDENRISPGDRQVIKDNLLEAILIQEEPVIRVQLAQCLYTVAKSDFPVAWPGLLPALLQNLSSSDLQRIYGSLVALKMVFKKYAYKMGDDREPFEAIISQTFPLLAALLQHAMTLVDPAQAQAAGVQPGLVHEILRLVTKLFHFATQVQVPRYLKEDIKRLDGWMAAIAPILQTKDARDPKVSGRPLDDDDDLARVPLSKAKKWAARSLLRLFQRFGRPQLADADSKELAEYIFQHYAATMQDLFMHVLVMRAELFFVPSIVMQLAFSYLTTSLNHAALYQKMKPRMEFLIVSSILPQLCMSQADLVDWEENPQEFLRRQLDIMEEFYDPKIAATNLLSDLVRVRTRDTLPIVLNAVTHILNTYQTGPRQAPCTSAVSPVMDRKSNQNISAFIEKDGALRMIGSLIKMLSKHDEYKHALEQLLITHVVPEFQSQFGFLRGRACWMVQHMSRFEFSSNDTLMQCVQLVVERLKDPDLPVKLYATTAISELVHNSEIVGFLKPQIALILQEYFILIDEVGSDGVVQTLTEMISNFGADIAPFAVELCQRLLNMFMQLVSNQSGNSDEDEESALTAIGCIRAINAVLYSLEDTPAAYAPIEELLQPLLTQMLCEEGIEYLEDILEMITALTYFPDTISPFMWQILGAIFRIFDAYAADYVGDMLAPIDNYISKGTEVFLKSEYLQMVLLMVQKLFADEDRKQESVLAAKLLDTVFVYARASNVDIDAVLVGIVEMVGDKLVTSEYVNLKLQCCNVLGAAAYYKPDALMEICGMKGEEFTKTLFNHWMSCVEHMKGRSFMCKMNAIGLASLCSLPLAKVAPALQQNFAAVVEQAVQLLSMQTENEADDEDSDDATEGKPLSVEFGMDGQLVTGGGGAGDDDDEDGDAGDLDFRDLGEEDDAIDEEDVEYLAKLRARLEDGSWLEDCFEEHEQDETFESPLDDVDEYVFFSQALATMAQSNAEFYAHFQGAASPALTQAIQAHLQKAEGNKAAAAAAAAEAAAEAAT